jgi:hypothetical protein
LNNPLKYIDPTGHQQEDPKDNPNNYEDRLIIDVHDDQDKPITDTQVVTDLQTMTGVEQPIRPLSHTANYLNWLGGNNRAAGAALGSTTLTWGTRFGIRTPQGAGVVVGIAGGGLVGTLLWDLLSDDPTTLPLPRVIPDTAPPDNRQDGEILWRGLYVGHDGYNLGLLGIAIPIGGPSTPYEHNAWAETNSIYTSWTRDPGFAAYRASIGGPGGIVLEKYIPRSRMVRSPDLHSEAEVLVIGVVTGARVIKQ